MTNNGLTTDTLNILLDTQQVIKQVDTLKLYYTEHYAASDSTNLTTGKGEIHPGLQGTQIPYRLNADNGGTALLFLCFFLSAYVLTNGKRFLLQQLKDFQNVKERGNLFNNSTATDFKYRVILLFQTSVLLGICFFDYFHDSIPELLIRVPSYIVLGTNILICVLYYLLKWLIYSFSGWIFFDKARTTIWLEAYSTILYYFGFTLFPLVLLMVYFDLSASILLPLELFFIIFAKIMMFYKWIKLFFHQFSGLFLLILYFCALEIVPCLLLYQGMIRMNNILLIKF